MSSEFVTTYNPPEKRRSYAEGGIEERLTEAGVMLALALHLLGSSHEGTVSIHPDGEHAKRFDIPEWLNRHGFCKVQALGKTAYGGIYRRGSETIRVDPRSGNCDVVGEIDGQRVVIECKGGTINSRHAGQLSRLRRGLCEAIGLLLARPPDGSREIAAVPWTVETARLADRMAARCRRAGIDIALVRRDGSIDWAVTVQPTVSENG